MLTIKRKKPIQLVPKIDRSNGKYCDVLSGHIIFNQCVQFKHEPRYRTDMHTLPSNPNNPYYLLVLPMIEYSQDRKEAKQQRIDEKKPLKQLYLELNNQIEGLFYQEESVKDRKSDKITHLLIVIPERDKKLELEIYSKIADLMRDFPYQLFDFRIVRRNGRSIQKVSDGYIGYVYP